MGELSREEYLKNCDEDIISVLILHSLDFKDLKKLDSLLFSIDFEVWSETGRVLNHLERGNYTGFISNEIANELEIYFRKILEFPSEKWSSAEFDKNIFWKESRVIAKKFKVILNIDTNDYWS